MTADEWSATQAAAVAAAEAIAATAAAEVAAEAAVTARTAVDVASAAAVRAADKAIDVAARAVLAAAAADAEAPTTCRSSSSAPGAAAATAAAKVAGCVTAVATAASAAATEAADVISEQLAADIAATAVAVTFAGEHPGLTDHARQGTSRATTYAGSQPTLATRPGLMLGGAHRLLADQLRRGIAADELRLHYQPIIDLGSGRPVGVEALVRWQHPVRGLLGPGAFIGVAEQTGLIGPLGTWVLHEACRMAVSLQDRAGAPLTVAVNLSGRQISDRGLVSTVRAALQGSGCSAERLVFEVTETALVTDLPAAVDSLRELRALGARVAIDDFGTGYAPLTYLKRLAADDLKIDRSFVAGLGTDSYDTAIVASLIKLAHGVDVRCVAEGVETVEQLAHLRELGCDFAQGFLFCRPVNAISLAGWLDRHVTLDGEAL